MCQGHRALLPSLPDTVEAVACLTPTRAHPPHTTTPCHYMSYGPSPRPCGPPRRRLGWGGVPRNVVARGGGVDVGGPCGCQASRRAARCTAPKNCQGERQESLGGSQPCVESCVSPEVGRGLLQPKRIE